MKVAVRRLNEGARAALTTHLLALPPDDRWLRFGSSLTTNAVAAYVEGIDFDRDAVFGIHDDELALIGAAHLAFEHDFAELGVSIMPAHRRRGAGGALFARAAVHARNRLASRLVMHCRCENVPIMRIARRSGMAIVVDGADANAHLELSPASAASILGEYVDEGFAFHDYLLKAQLAAWKSIHAALEGSRHGRRRDPHARAAPRA